MKTLRRSVCSSKPFLDRAVFWTGRMALYVWELVGIYAHACVVEAVGQPFPYLLSVCGFRQSLLLDLGQVCVLGLDNKV